MPDYVVDFRGRPACPCLARWLPVYERELLARGEIKVSLDIYQLIGGAPQSGGTHTDGGAADTGQTSDVAIWVARQMGADACWHRPYNWDNAGGMAHTHLVLTGCPHNGPARYQIDAVRRGENGLANHGPDTGPRPLSGRTWREGIAWANQQQEERDMAEYGQRILDAIHRLEERDKAREKRYHDAVLALLDKLADDVQDDASKAQVKRLRVAVEALAAPDVEPSE